MKLLHDLPTPNAGEAGLRFRPASGNVLAAYVEPQTLRSGLVLPETQQTLPPMYRIAAVSPQAAEAGYKVGDLAVLTPGRIPMKVPVDGQEYSIFLHQEILGVYDALEAARG